MRDFPPKWRLVCNSHWFPSASEFCRVERGAILRARRFQTSSSLRGGLVRCSPKCCGRSVKVERGVAVFNSNVSRMMIHLSIDEYLLRSCHGASKVSKLSRLTIYEWFRRARPTLLLEFNWMCRRQDYRCRLLSSKQGGATFSL